MLTKIHWNYNKNTLNHTKTADPLGHKACKASPFKIKNVLRYSQVSLCIIFLLFGTIIGTHKNTNRHNKLWLVSKVCTKADLCNCHFNGDDVEAVDKECNWLRLTMTGWILTVSCQWVLNVSTGKHKKTWENIRTHKNT